MRAALLEFPAILCVAFLALHAYRVRGPHFTLAVFGLLPFLLFFKEKGTMQGEGLYDVMPMSIEFDGVSLVVLLGWIFTFYVALCLAEAIFDRRMPRYAHRFFAVYALTSVLISFIALVMEVTGATIGWWRWNEFSGVAPDLPVLTMVLWPHVGMEFFFPLVLLFSDNSLARRIPLPVRYGLMLTAFFWWVRPYSTWVPPGPGVVVPLLIAFIPWVRRGPPA